MVISVLLFSILACAAIAKWIMVGHLRFYDYIVLLGAAGLVAVRISRHLKRKKIDATHPDSR